MGTHLVHATDNEPCHMSEQDHGDLICVHGLRLVEVNDVPAREMTDPRVPSRFQGPV